MVNADTSTSQAAIEGSPAKENMEESLKSSPSGDKNSIGKDHKNASAADKSEAASIIAGAMLMCKDFGIKVDYANHDGDLVLIVRKVQAVQQNGKLTFKYIE